MRNFSMAFTAGLVSFSMVTPPPATQAAPRPAKELLAYFGTYTGARSKGIYCARFDPAKGAFTPPVLAAETVNPTFLAVHPKRPWLYAVNETDRFDGKRQGGVSAFSFDPASGKLTLLNQRASGGSGPCHVSVDRQGKCVLAANYGSGSVASFKIGPDGGLSEPVSTLQHEGSSINRQRQAGPHAHQILADPRNRFVLTCDLGLDQVLITALNPANAVLAPHDPPFTSVKPGSGPRHLAFHPSGRYVYLVNEMGSTLSSFAYEPKAGALKELQTVSTLPSDFRGNSSGAEVQVHPSGKFVYSSNRGDDSIAIFGISSRTGEAKYVGREPVQGKTPRHFTLDPSGQWLIVENQDSNNVVIFRVDQRSGLLTPAGQNFELGAPVCLVFVPAK